MKRGTLEVEAKKTAKHPRVKAEIERLMLELLPPVANMRAAYDHAFSTILKLTLEAPDLRLRFDAARWLRDEYERRQQLEAPTVSESAEMALATLRELYQQIQAMPERDGPLTVEIDQETDAMETDALSLAAPGDTVAITTVDAPAAPADACTGEGHQVPSSDQKFALVPVPGSFPRKFRRIRVK